MVWLYEAKVSWQCKIILHIINIKTEDFFEDMANDVAERFDASNYQVDKPLPTGKNKKVIKIDER